jgi:indole-3-glycerol phosphate synthase
VTIGRTASNGTILDRIMTRTAADLEARKAAIPWDELERRAADNPAPVPFRSALTSSNVSVIAEIKRASPSRGVFPVQVDPPAVARAYLDGGAAALSVLTDGPYFHGSLADLEVVVETAHQNAPAVPVLRKDFMLDRYQILEARASGADAVLLIVAALNDRLLRDLLRQAEELHLAALVEVHDEVEMKRAADVGASLVGINNRDLRTFEVDLAVTERLAPLAPGGALLVGESGIFSRDDIVRLGRAGVQAVLVGERLIAAEDRARAVRELCGATG